MLPEQITEIPRVKVFKNEEFLSYARWILARAKKGILIGTYKFELSERPGARDLNNLVYKLYTLAARGLPVRILLNSTGRRSGLTRINEYAAGQLKKRGLLVRYLPDERCQHAKFLVVDDCLAIIGSHNWSPKSVTENLEMSVVVNDEQEVSEIKKHFERVWEISKEF